MCALCHLAKLCVDWSDHYLDITNFQNSKTADCGHLENRKLPHLGNGFNGCHEIGTMTHIDPSYSLPYRPENFHLFKIKSNGGCPPFDLIFKKVEILRAGTI